VKITEEQLQDFLISESINLETIGKELNSFNPFSVLGIGHKELQHSNFLAWLLRPNDNHQLDDYFLTAFLSLISSIRPKDKIELFLQNLQGTIIYREWNNIDLVIVNEGIKTVVIIENKVRAKLSDKQLLRYFNQAESYWDDDWKKHYIYLTALPRTLEKDDAEMGYENIHYGQILEILEKINSEISPDEEIKIFIQQYIENIKVKIMGDSKPQELARKIYIKHKAVIDYISAQKPTIYTKERFNAVKEYFVKNDTFETYNEHRTNFISVLPKSIEQYFQKSGFNSWFPDKGKNICPMMMIEFWLEKERLYVKFCMGAIWNELEKAKLQKIKDVYYKEIREFSSLKKNKKIYLPSTDPKYKYVNLASLTLMDIKDANFESTEKFMTDFKKKIITFEEQILNPFIEDVEQSEVLTK